MIPHPKKPRRYADGYLDYKTNITDLEGQPNHGCNQFNTYNDKVHYLHYNCDNSGDRDVNCKGSRLWYLERGIGNKGINLATINYKQVVYDNLMKGATCKFKLSNKDNHKIHNQREFYIGNNKMDIQGNSDILNSVGKFSDNPSIGYRGVEETFPSDYLYCDDSEQMNLYCHVYHKNMFKVNEAMNTFNSYKIPVKGTNNEIQTVDPFNGDFGGHSSVLHFFRPSGSFTDYLQKMNNNKLSKLIILFSSL
jgi:hypothetical protein